MKFDPPALERFLYWIKERYAIYLRRERGEPKPWTEDKTLQENFFTMPYRELDKTTLWFRQNVRYPLWDNPAVLFATICFRWFNFIPTGLVLIDREFWTKNPGQGITPDGKGSNLLTDWKPNEAKKRLLVTRHLDPYTKDKIFTGAFNISNSGSTKPKLDRVIDDYINPVWKDRKTILLALECLDPLTLRKAHSIIKDYPGLGGSGFMAYEIICDLRFTYLLENARDIDTWCNMGPGAKRGLNRLLNLTVDGPMYKNWLFKMRELHTLANSALHTSSKVIGATQDDFTKLQSRGAARSSHGPMLPHLEMREIEHSLCEFDKYERVRLGQGKSKRSYPGRR